MGQPIADALAEGKPVNQANALLHCSSEIVMVNDMNQGADFEQLLFLPSLLAEFHTDGKGNHAALVASADPSGPPVQPAWLPYRPVCSWPDRAATFLAGLTPPRSRVIHDAGTI